MSDRQQLNGIYAITDPQLLPDDTQLFMAVESALKAGLSCLQYRDKKADASKALRQARGLAELCGHYGCLLIINDDVLLAKASGADGIHLGQEDGVLLQARDYLGPDVLIGRTCHNSLQLAEEAKIQGADYLAFGRCYPSSTKPSAPATSLAIFTQAAHLGLPLVGIGGINSPARAAEVKAAGASMIAAVEGIFAQSNPQQAVHQYHQAIKDTLLNSLPTEVQHDSLSRTF
ncbi:thiamine-phosphate pyrophosphorylase [Marinospirillum celere]|uniref:Thiamine-phosphate synthase n=1 Tax=Marinospirillum celere TaxID=1122252 RepID=A0A1I1IJA7_9GAMM|nr:thiamine phosphate synthase [Marinospirillum celere]SFC34278.1 thiamine-phosphate pyrophosphorylase [Marinospirillum celere]